MQRLRAGLTGLALVFLVTLVGSIALSPSDTQSPRPADPGEPLAELGVAPSPGDRAAGTESVAPPAAPAPPVAGPGEERPIAGSRSPASGSDQVLI